jgi:hypothetical protein
MEEFMKYTYAAILFSFALCCLANADDIECRFPAQKVGSEEFIPEGKGNNRYDAYKAAVEDCVDKFDGIRKMNGLADSEDAFAVAIDQCTPLNCISANK